MEEGAKEMEMSPEELNARKEEMRKFYEDSIPYLSAQCQHEEFLSKISEARFKRMHYEVQLAMLMQGPEKEENRPDQEKETRETPVSESRKLKRE
jgi:hypothetical protein